MRGIITVVEGGERFAGVGSGITRWGTVPESRAKCRGVGGGVLGFGTVAGDLVGVPGAITPLQGLKCCRRPCGTVTGVKILKIFRGV